MNKLRILVLSLLTLLSACSSDVTEEITGSWRGETVKQNFTFYLDGRIVLEDLRNSTYEGVYTLVGDTLTCSFDSPVFSRDVVMTVNISGDEMVLTSDRDREEVYSRL